MIEYLNPLVTLIVGSVAFLVYWLGRKHHIKSAATIIIMDIRRAESVAHSILDRGVVNIETADVVSENNWNKYKHLFASNFSQDDYAAFDMFFESCSEMSDARKRMHDTFSAALNAKADLIQRELYEVNKIDDADKIKKRENIIDRINNELYVFDPNEPKHRMIKNLQLMGKLSNTLAFEKLKRKAGLK